MNNFTTEGSREKLRKFECIVLLFNGCFALFLSAVICLTNIVLIAATATNPHRLEKVIDKIHNAFCYINVMAGAMFLPYFGVAEILQALEITTTTILFPSYLSSTLFFFAQSNVQVPLFILIERCTAFVSPHFNLRVMTKRKVLITLFLSESFSLLFVCLSFAGINERVFYTIYIHVFFSAPMLFLLITTFVTYWKLKNRNRVVSNEIPQTVEQLELHKKRNVRTARKYLTIVTLFFVPIFLCMFPWYVVKVIEITHKNPSLTTDAGFFWQRFSIPLLFVPGATGPITLTLRFEAYYNSVKRFIRR
ncbi:hypothetical protein OS493_024371 [Desmophyllum pertusum]|uniref:G-protein coupled receptors family 1 profile domain-containing protein n=1 Tax=Desmophyllum pertusum TaxID=174260 RepID=A0A9W9YN55_9CNID|nr:hypothetical protein OS493_024371 [Desmophyllum pertusum]